MSVPDHVARNRYFMMIATRIGGAGGALVGLVLLSRAQTLPLKVLGMAIVLSAMLVMAVVPRSLARRWRTPPDT